MSQSVALSVVPIQKLDEVNVIFGQSHFIKTVEDLHEAIVNSCPGSQLQELAFLQLGVKFGLAFCEASGERLVRTSGTDDTMIEGAKQAALDVACGHTFWIFLLPPIFPLHVLRSVKVLVYISLLKVLGE
jgi:adenosine/AMP kinase